MTVFNSVFKIIRKSMKTFITPLIILIMFTVFAQVSSNAQIKNEEMTIVNIALENNDKSGIVSESLLKYLEDKVEIVDIGNNTIDDMLYYQRIYLYLEIPEDFSNQFLNNQSKIELMINAESPHSYMVQQNINEFLNAYKALYDAGFSDDIIEHKLNEAYSKSSIVELLKQDEKPSDAYYLFSNMEIYPLFITICSIIISVLMIFNQKEVKNRIITSSKSSKSFNKSLLFSTLIVSNIIWVFSKVIGFALMHQYIDFNTYPLLLLNSYVFMNVTLSIAFFLSKFIADENVKTAVINSVSLGLAFISGVFIQSSLLSETIINVSKLFPVYWAVHTNNLIAEARVNEIFVPLLIQVLFIIAFILLGLIVSKDKKQKV